MKKVEVMASNEKNKITPSWIDRFLIPWIMNDGKKWLYLTIPLIILALYFIVKSISGASSGTQDYLQTYNNVATLVKASKGENVKDPSLISNLEKNLSKHPELQARYDGMINQALIIQNLPKEAESFLQSALMQLKEENLIHYQQFAETTTMISLGKFKEAKKASLALKEEILKENENRTKKDNLTNGDILFAFNLLRLTSLEHQLGSKEGEKQAWLEWDKYSNDDTQFSKQAFQIVASLFEDGNVNLESYKNEILQ